MVLKKRATERIRVTQQHWPIVKRRWLSLPFEKEGMGRMVDSRGALYDLTWSLDKDDLAVSVPELSREQSLTVEWEDKNTFVINNCKCTYEFTRQ